MPDTIETLTGASSLYWPERQTKRFPSFAASKQERYDVAVIGGGWVGLFATYYLAKAGKSVILLDKGLIGGEASGHSGGIILDKFEGDLLELIRLCGKDQERIRTILRASHEAMAVIPNVAAAEKFDSGFRSVGHITGFRGERERNKYLRSHEMMHMLLPDLYPDENVAWLKPKETGARWFFKGGAAYSDKGGVFNPYAVVEGILAALPKIRKHTKKRVSIYEGSEVTDFEPAAQRGVRLHIGNASLEAQHVVLAGGETSRLIASGNDHFPASQPVMAAMLATQPLPDDVFQRIANKRDPAAPLICTGIGAPYYRLTEDRRLLFGSSARAGWNEFSQIIKDVRRDVLKVFPSLGNEIALEECPVWGRMLHHSRSDLPFAYALGREKVSLGRWPEKPQRDKDRTLLDLSMIGIAGLGGQGNNFGPYLGKLVAQTLIGDKKAYEQLRLFHAVAPTKPLTIRVAKSRLAAERRL